MNILICSYAFYPSVGGVESVSLTLADSFVQTSHSCKVTTKTVGTKPDSFLFDVVRNPTLINQIQLVKWADIIIYNGANLMMQPWPILSKKTFIWIHTGYQVSCIDGLGWSEGKPAPLTPFKSFISFKNRNGLIKAIPAGIKLWIRRIIAQNFVAQNVAITQWVQSVQPLPRQVQIYNPFEVNQLVSPSIVLPDYSFIFVGRIVSEKGVATLLQALSIVHQQTGGAERLLIVGDGSAREEMKLLAHQLQIANSVTFVGKKSGQELAEWVARGQIAIVPSAYYEPMGIVALELLAAGKNIIVSEQGGLKECIGEAGLTFPNEDHHALANAMIQLLTDEELRKKQLAIAKEQVKRFDPALSVAQYIRLLEAVYKGGKVA